MTEEGAVAAATPSAEKFFQAFAGDTRPLVLYGVKSLTERILIDPRAAGLNIVGLLDRPDGLGLPPGSVKFGLPVLSLAEAASKAKAIVITARPAFVPMIYRRVCHLGMPVYDPAGHKLISSGQAPPGQFPIDTLYDLGFFGFGPLVLNLLHWIKEQAGNRPVLFGARDGYLFQRMYSGNGVYFPASRRALSQPDLSGYRTHCRSLDLPPGPIYFFDPVTSGTIASKLPTILDREIVTLCAVMIRPAKVRDYRSMLGDVDLYDQTPHLYRAHYLAESIFTAPHPEVATFGSHGEPVYCCYKDSNSGWEAVKRAQDGIAHYVDCHRLPSASHPPLADAGLGWVLSRVSSRLKSASGLLISDHYRGMPEMNPWDTIL